MTAKKGIYIELKGIVKFCFTLLVSYHIQAIILILFLLVLSLQKGRKMYFIDTDFIRSKFVLKLASMEDLTEEEVKNRLYEFEEAIIILAEKTTNNGFVIKKGAYISGGIDITEDICQKLEFDNCESYE